MLAMLRRHATADEGMTLVELLVAMVILTIVIGLSTGSLIFVLGKQSNIGQSSDAASQTQTGMELLSRVIRQGVYPTGSSSTSTIIQTATATQLKITSRLTDSSSLSASQMTSTATQYIFTLTGSTLYWQQATVSCAATCTYGTPTAQKALIRGVRNTAGATACAGAMSTAEQEGPFHYVVLNKTTGVPNAALATVAGTDPINAPDTYIGGIAYVTINFFTQTQTGPQAPACTRLSDFVQLRNKT